MTASKAYLAGESQDKYLMNLGAYLKLEMKPAKDTKGSVVNGAL
jgi:hypothetical protein